MLADLIRRLILTAFYLMLARHLLLGASAFSLHWKAGLSRHSRFAGKSAALALSTVADSETGKKLGSAHGRIPVTVLSGFLGAGKTTFLNHVLANQQGLKFGLVVNDVAAVNIDAKQVRAQTINNSGAIETLELQNGCVCCSLAEDLVGSIARLVEMSENKGSKLDHLIVECSGVAEPRRIRDFFHQAEDYEIDLIKKVQLDTLITVVDAMSFFTLFGSDTDIMSHKDLAYRPTDKADPEQDGNGQRKITELLLEQVECSDIVLINKCDLLYSPKDVDLVEDVIRNVNPMARTWVGSRGEVSDPMKLIGSAGGKGAATLSFLDEHRSLLHSVKNKTSEHDHNHKHEAAATKCEVKGCTDPSHDHSHNHPADSHGHDHGHDCKGSSCTHSSHSHDHDHGHGHGHDHQCTGSTCTDPSHDHSHSHSHSHDHHEATTAEQRFGITSFVYQRRTPFHPIRFSRFLQSMGQLSMKGMSGLTLPADPQALPPGAMEARRALLRSKGFVWMATSKAAAYFMSHAGQYFELQVLGRWWADIPSGEWPAGIQEDIGADFQGTHGDRRQELVFIGQFGKTGGHSQQALEKLLDSCLLTADEMKDYETIASKGDQALQQHFSPPKKA